ncbi:hypothetical protein Esti_001548 [Eimeria stiedai]
MGENTYLWFTRDPCGVVCMLLTHSILIFSNYTITSCLVNWSSLGFWRFLIAAAFQVLAVLAALSHLKCAFGDPGAVPLPSTREIAAPSTAARELQHPGALTPDSRSGDKAVDTPHAQKGCKAKMRCASFGFLRLFALVFCPLRVFKNFIGSKRIESSNSREEEALEEGWAPPICRHCEAPKPVRAHHCSGCKRCVIRMDHHCPWINNCVGFLNQKYFMLFLLYVNLMCCTAFIVLVCRVVTCVDSTANNGFEDPAGGEAFEWKDSASFRTAEAYQPIPSRLAEYHPPPDAQLSPSAARRHWNAVRSMHVEHASAPVPSFLQSSESMGPPPTRRRLASAEDFVNGVLHAAQDPLSRWMQSGGYEATESAQEDDNIFGAAGAAHADAQPRQTPFDGAGYRRPRRHFLCDVALQSAVCGAMTFMFSFIFGLFTVVMFCDQLSSILSNTTGVESLKRMKNEKKSACQLLKEVFGGSFGCYWFLPVPVTPYQQKRFVAELQRFPGAPENACGSDAAGVGGRSIASVRSAYEAEAATFPLAVRRGRSPHSSEDGNAEGGGVSSPLTPGRMPEDVQFQQVLPEEEEDQHASLENALRWTPNSSAKHYEESLSPNGFSSPILKQPRPLHVNHTADGFWGLNNTLHASTPAAAPAAAAAAGRGAALKKEGEMIEEGSSLCGAGNPPFAT